jgi:hypothetical protein
VDEIVIRGMLRWPNVPAVYGWLTLDRRGNWMIKTVGARFERISNPAVIEFIGRNYACDEEGRWYFQNGPQRVFACLEYTPWIYRTDDAGGGFVAHTGDAPRALRALFVDDAGGLLLQTEQGIGAILDRDLPVVIERLRDEAGRPVEPLLERLARAADARDHVALDGSRLPIASIRAAEVARRFGFVPSPTPRPGEPEC